MMDILFYQNYTPVADVVAIALCIIFWLLLRSTYTVKQTNLVIFWCCVWGVALAAVSNITFHILIDDLTQEKIIPIYIVRSVSYISLMLVYVLFDVYLQNHVGMEEKRKKHLNLLLWGGFAVFSLWEVSTPFTKLGFWIDLDLQIHQNYYLDVFRIAFVFDSLILIYMLFAYRRKLLPKLFRCMCSIILVEFLIVGLQTYLLSTSYTCIAFTFPIMSVLVLFHYNAYDVETGTLDAKSFDAYIREASDKEFSIMYLHVEDMDAAAGQRISKELSGLVETKFRYACIFRLGDDRMALVYRRDKKSDAGENFILQELKYLYEKEQIDYKIILLDSGYGNLNGSEYLSLGAFLEERILVNTVYRCKKEDVGEYLKATDILNELKDIHQHHNLNDARVKVYCQPVLNTATNTFTSAEALMRLVLPECGMVFPEQFIPLAEKHGYIHTLSEIILNKTCAQIRNFQNQCYEIDRVSVNFSIMELRDKSFCEDVTEIIRQNGIPYEKIAIELTESRNESDFGRVKNIMEHLQGYGIKFYLDDFGTGYSNFERIIDLPIDIVKFDRSLTILAGKDDESRFMVGSFSDIFKKSNYQILFEGVEDESDEKRCEEMNALYLQGYKYSRPIPMENLIHFLKKGLPNQNTF